MSTSKQAGGVFEEMREESIGGSESANWSANLATLEDKSETRTSVFSLVGSL